MACVPRALRSDLTQLVLDGHAYAARLPDVVEAVFFPEHGSVHHAEGDEARARRVHAALAQTLRASGGGGARTALPLLAFDVAEARRGFAPFREVRTH